MGVYQYNVGQADSHWSLLGSAIKVCLAVGRKIYASDALCIDRTKYWLVPLSI